MGTHNIEVVFTGSYFYVESTNNVNSEVLSTTIFEFDEIEVFRNQEFFLSSYLFDDLSNPMANQHVNLTFNGKRYHLVTDDAGMVEQNITLAPNHKLGNYAAKWDYLGFEYYLPASSEQEVRVVASTNIVLSSDSEVIVGETFSFIGSL